MEKNMIWQDIVIAIASIVFSFALVLQVYHGFKYKSGPIKLETSIPTFLGLYVICFVYITLTLYFSASISFLVGTIWFILFVQRLLYNKRVK